MQDTIRYSIQGFVKIIDKNTGVILVDTHNDVLFGNMSTALAYSLIGNSNYFLSYMAFGNGGAFVGQGGTISYKPSLGGPNSLIKNPNAMLYNPIYVKKLSNDSTNPGNYNPLSKAYIPTENLATNYEDIIVEVTLGYNEPPTGLTPSSTIQQLALDDSTFIGTSASNQQANFDPSTLVFNEIGLFAAPANIFPGAYTQTTTEVEDFIQSPLRLMLTHVVFHPIQKSSNRSLEIVYTLRIQMGAS